ncbi:MAG: CRISPR-associated endonuclease Cas3'' [Spirochaetaceae bacterium]|jgi:CRISPR-associated endonuclease/helicase Cas3|nr:CRISPR-associated endonuclease Cas3'' [Spirochaetaceae bacterium]
MNFIAHIRRQTSGEWDDPQALEAHLAETAALAAQFAADFDSQQWAYALGMSHDTGKGTAAWQEYIRDKSGFGYDEEASSETVPRKLEHSGPGAKLAEEVWGKGVGRFLAYGIAGHHAGLPDWTGAQSALEFRLQNTTTEKIGAQFKTMLAEVCPQTPPWKLSIKGLDMSLWIRMLFSCLLDADRLNTEGYMDPEKRNVRGTDLSIAELHKQFNGYMKTKTAEALGVSSPQVYQARQQVLADCRAAAAATPGFFSLNVPTGGGKTLSSMAFALAHAEKYGKKRIIYVIPYTSIIEQNAEVFRNIFGADAIVEHHANLDEDDRTLRCRLATENWDAPVIVTTNVQFFESLFAAKTSRCRRVHAIANSVVVLDEAQMLPAGFLEPILETMRLLVEHYRVSFVICTATQPVFEKQQDFPQFPGLPQGSIREIVQDIPALYAALERVKVEFPKDTASAGWQELAEELSGYDQVLCIVSDRKSCRELHAVMPAGTYHLSALMCAQQRSDTIAAIKDKLHKREAVRVISTQLVEAGVDIDFPVVYRAMAGLDSIAQSAGRCNREGKLNAEGKLGKVVVFNGPRQAPAGILRKAAETTARRAPDLDNPLDPREFAHYFSELYWKLNSLDTKNIMGLLKPEPPHLGIQFRSAAQAFQIIDDTSQRTVLIPYGKGEELIALLKAAGRTGTGFETKLLRKLQRYTVSIYTDQFFALQNRGSLEEIMPGIFALNNTVEYDKQIGLLIDETPQDPVDFIV